MMARMDWRRQHGMSDVSPRWQLLYTRESKPGSFHFHHGNYSVWGIEGSWIGHDAGDSK